MIPRAIKDHNVTFRKPADWNDEQMGRCTDLLVRRVMDGPNPTVASAWEPTPAELALLAAGGSVVLTVWGGQPPVMLTVEPQLMRAKSVAGEQATDIAEEYMGDGVYASPDNGNVRLRASHSVIYLDGEVWTNLLSYVERLRRAAT